MYKTYLILLSILVWCSLATGRSPKAVPVAPDNLQVLDRDFDFIYLTWQDNSDDEERFIIERHVEGEAYTPYDTLGPDEESYLDSYVQPLTHYYYRVYAENADGSSAYSNEVDVTTPDLPNQPPNRPLQPEGSFDSINAVRISWQDNSENELQFKLFRSEDNSIFGVLDSVSRDVAQYTDYRILAHSIYYYYIVAENNYGTSSPSDTIRVDVGEIIEGGITPVLSLSLVTTTSVSLEWRYLPDSDISYTLHRISDEDSVSIALNNSTRYDDNGLTPNTDYRYRLQAVDQSANSVWSNTVSTTTLPWFTQYRNNDSLITFFVFSQLRNNQIPDQSWYKTPADLTIPDTTGMVFIDSSFLRLEASNRLIAPNASKITEACQRSNELTLECWIKTSQLPEWQPAKIMSLENENGVAFSISCVRDEISSNRLRYFVNLTTKTTDAFGNPDFTSIREEETGVLQHIVYTHNKLGEENLYINGTLDRSGFRPPGYDDWENSNSLIMANDSRNAAPWTGNLYMCAVYNRALPAEEILQNYYASPFSDIFELNSEDYSMLVSPNPTGDLITVEFVHPGTHLEVTQDYSLVLLNRLGIVVREKTVSDIINVEKAQLRVADLSPGIYTLILRSPYGQIDAKNILIVP